MDARLKDLLESVASRLRRQRLLWLLAAVWLATAFVALSLLWQVRSGELSANVALGVAAATLGGLLVAACALSLCSFRDSKAVAARIEAYFPTLRQRLLTAVDQRPADINTPMNYLQTAVIDETLHHGTTHRWTLAVNQIATRFAWSVNALAFGLLLLVGIGLNSQLANAKHHGTDPPSLAELQPSAELTVEPGDVEIERGSNLVVTARFGANDLGLLPSEVQLIARRGDQQTQAAMTRNLSDPVFGGYLNEVVESTTYEVQYDGKVSPTYKVTVFDYPQLQRSDARLVFPQYTGLEEKRVDDTRRVSAVEGTQLTWICQLNKPVASCSLVDDEGKVLPLSADAENPLHYRATVTLQQSTRWTLKLVDAEGRENKYPPELVARVQPNQPPVMKLVAARDVRVSPLEELQVGARFRDDFGLLRYGLAYAMAGEEPHEIVLGETTQRKEEREASPMIDFEALAAEPDQLLSYHFWAEDFDAAGQPRRSESDMFFAEVRHFEEIFREGEPPAGGEPPPSSPNAQQADELAELQKQIITGTWNLIRRETAAEPSAAFADDVALLHESQQAAIEQLQELAAELTDPQSKEYVQAAEAFMRKAVTQLAAVADANSPPLLSPALASEQAAYQGLLKLRAREFEVSRQQQSQSKSSSSSQQQRQQQLDQLELKNDENRYETEQQARSEEEQQATEMRQVLSRLRELAQRQEDLNKQLKQLQSALEAAQTEQEREEIQRQLKRLREEQQELLRDTDELADRMNASQDQPATAEQQEQLAETRENVRQSSEALAQQDVSQALSAGTRAEREFKQMRDEVRQQAAGDFAESMQQMQQQAQQLQEQQQAIGQEIEQLEETNPGSLRSPQDRDQIRDRIGQQRQQLADLLDRMERTVSDAETSEPLLAEKLYDSFRKTQQRRVDQQLDMTNQLLERGLDPDASQATAAAEAGIGELREEIDEAAQSVLGDPTESLRRALGELEQVSDQLSDEIRENDPRGAELGDGEPGDGEPGDGEPGDGEPGDGGPGVGEPGVGEPGVGEPGQSQPGQSQPGQSQPGQSQPGQSQPGQSQPGQSQPGQSQPGQSQPGQSQPGQSQPGQSQPGQSQPGQSQPGQSQPGQSQPGQSQPGQSQPGREGSGGGIEGFAEAVEGRGAAPLTGEGFREWSDRLREIEELVEDPELRSQVAQVREAAREVRINLKRHSESPQWNLVREMIARPLEELKQRVAEELLRRSADRNALVPIDRDPVPVEFADQVEKYYEKLGSGK
ncbi:hypothetical protein [Rosistilla oblonga]|uniref:hypothetical protein n=1 Tax=Rosistilla oblonga TaxID=2527990 RepID=UPI003A97D7DF